MNRQYKHDTTRNPIENARLCGYDEPMKYLYTKDEGDESPEYIDTFINQHGEYIRVFCCDIHGG